MKFIPQKDTVNRLNVETSFLSTKNKQCDSINKKTETIKAGLYSIIYANNDEANAIKTKTIEIIIKNLAATCFI
ncbi:MAG: hypothetical protein R3Y10_10275 [Ferrimonas sp.]